MRNLPGFTFGEKVVKSQILNNRHAFTFGTSCLELQIENKIWHLIPRLQKLFLQP